MTKPALDTALERSACRYANKIKINLELLWPGILWLPTGVNSSKNKSKSKGRPQQAEVAQGVPGRLRPRIILTFRHYKGGRSSAVRTGRLYPRRNLWYSLSEAESTSGRMVLSGAPRKKSPETPPGIDPRTIRLVAQCLNHYATPGPVNSRLLWNKWQIVFCKKTANSLTMWLTISC